MARRSVPWVTTAGSSAVAANSGVHHRTFARVRNNEARIMIPSVSGINIDGAAAVMTASRIATHAAAVEDVAAVVTRGLRPNRVGRSSQDRVSAWLRIISVDTQI